jgi:hypothetical protein
MQALIRFGLLAVALVVCVTLIALHGVRGIVLVIAIMALATLPGTRAWRATERVLVRLTGSRRRAFVLIMATVICLVIAVNVYQYAHP